MADALHRHRHPWAIAVAVMLLTWLAVMRADAPPAARGHEAAADAFSAARARDVLTRVLGEQRPHPTGSRENQQVRLRIREELAGLGLQVREASSFACRGWTCAWVHNLVARIEGRESGPAVLVAVHHDSVAAGPGASDDGSGVAIVVELARALQHGAPPRHPIVLLVDDGEEIALLGAQAFVESDPWAADIAVVVNLEARGSTGPSAMFETKGPNAWLVDALAGALRHPAMSSLSAAVYELLPNDTDLTVFGEAGWAGVNFAYSDGVAHYHTPHDDLAHLDDRSLQHQGDNALATVHALSEGELSREPSSAGDVVYVDLLGRWVLRWPQAWMVPLAGLVLLGVAIAIGLGARRGHVRPVAAAGSTVAALGLLVVAGGLGWVVTAAVGWLRGGPSPMFEPYPGALQLSLVAIGVVLVGAFASRVSAATATFAAAGTWASLALLLAVALPGGSILFWIPAAAGLWPVSQLVARSTPRPAAVLTFAAISVAFVGRLGAPLYATLGLVAAPGLAVIATLVLLAAAPLLTAGFEAARIRRTSVMAATAVLVVATAVAVVLPVATVQHPMGLDLVWRRDRPTGTSTWVAGTLRDRLPAQLQAAGFDPTPAPIVGSSWPWSWLKVHRGPTSEGPIPASVTVTPVDGAPAGMRRATLTIAEGVGSLELYLPDGVQPHELRIDGQPVAGLRKIDWHHPDGSTEPHLAVWLFGPPPQLQIDVLATGPFTLRTSVMRFGEPHTPEAATVRAARPDWAVPFQFGDFEAIVDAHPM